MGRDSVLQRLFRLRRLEEETQRMAVELAVSIRSRLEMEANAAEERMREAKRELQRRIGDSDTVARVAASTEMEDEDKRRTLLQRKLDAAGATVQRMRTEFLSRRMARQQVESLVEQEAIQVREQELRRAQQSLDDWYNRKGVASSADKDDSESKGRT